MQSKQCATSRLSLDVALLLSKIKVLTRTNQIFLIRSGKNFLVEISGIEPLTS